MTDQSPKPEATSHLRDSLPPWALVTIGLTSIAFVVFPQLDLAFSRFFAVGGSFPTDGHWLFHAFSRTLTLLGRAVGVALVIALAIGLLPMVAQSALGGRMRRQRRAVAFLLLSLVVGPGLLANYVLKTTTSRARPANVTEFGGSQKFTRAFAVANQCDHNCSFVSGDVAGATLVVAGFFIARSRRARMTWLIGGLAFGAAVGAARIVSGHHFLSDVFVAMALTYVVTALCAAWLLRAPNTTSS